MARKHSAAAASAIIDPYLRKCTSSKTFAVESCGPPAETIHTHAQTIMPRLFASALCASSSAQMALRNGKQVGSAQDGSAQLTLREWLRQVALCKTRQAHQVATGALGKTGVTHQQGGCAIRTEDPFGKNTADLCTPFITQVLQLSCRWQTHESA